MVDRVRLLNGPILGDGLAAWVGKSNFYGWFPPLITGRLTRRLIEKTKTFNPHAAGSDWFEPKNYHSPRKTFRRQK